MININKFVFGFSFDFSLRVEKRKQINMLKDVVSMQNLVKTTQPKY